MNATLNVLVINPGSTSTKIAIYSQEGPLHEHELTHSVEKLAAFQSNLEQEEFRLKEVESALENWNFSPRKLAAVIGRGAPLKPLEGGVYYVDDTLVDDIHEGNGPGAFSNGHFHLPGITSEL